MWAMTTPQLVSVTAAVGGVKAANKKALMRQLQCVLSRCHTRPIFTKQQVTLQAGSVIECDAQLGDKR